MFNSCSTSGCLRLLNPKWIIFAKFLSTVSLMALWEVLVVRSIRLSSRDPGFRPSYFLILKDNLPFYDLVCVSPLRRLTKENILTIIGLLGIFRLHIYMNPVFISWLTTLSSRGCCTGAELLGLSPLGGVRAFFKTLPLYQKTMLFLKHLWKCSFS